MAPDRDAEAQQQPWQAAAGDEHTPLLHNLRQPSAESGEGQPGAIQEEAPPPARRYYAWHVVWVVAAALLAVVFVKGWIDAGADVNVGGTMSSNWHYSMCNWQNLSDVFLLHPQFDLNKALKRALGGGLSGAAAMVLQVLLLMVIRCQ